MKHFFKTVLFTVMPLAAVSADVIKVCPLGTSPAHTVKVVREHEIANSYVYKLRYAGASSYFYDSANESRGLSVRIACLGRKPRALVVYGEFSSNFIQGFVIARNHRTGRIDRLDFAERRPPQWVYLDKEETLVIVPTEGKGEYASKKYVLYRRANKEAADAEISGIDVLPSPGQFEVIRLEPDVG